MAAILMRRVRGREREREEEGGNRTITRRGGY